MAKTTNIAETRLIFTLVNGDTETTRTIALPGAPSTTEEYNQAVADWRTFRNYYIDPSHAGYVDFVQPSNWRDATQSTSADPQTPYTTTEIELEFYTGQKTRYGAEDLNV